MAPTAPSRVAPILVDHDPFAGKSPSWSTRACWPAHWIGVADPAPPVVAGYRLSIDCPEDVSGTIHVSADERFELYVDGELVSRGPDRGDPEHWPFHSFTIDLDRGSHWFAARVWSLGHSAPFAQLSAGHGFLLAAEGLTGGLDAQALHTGTAAWQAVGLPGYGERPKGDAWGCGSKLLSDGRRIPWGWTTADEPDGSVPWQDATIGDVAYARAWVNDMPPGRMLVPATLPPQREELAPPGRVRHVSSHAPQTSTRQTPIRATDSQPAEVQRWQGILDGSPLTVPPRTCWRVLIDLQQYTCAYPQISTRGGTGAQLRVHWQESLYAADGSGKGDRDAIEGKLFGRPDLTEDGTGDLFIAGGGKEKHSTLWWEAGRYVEVLVSTADEPLQITALEFVSTHYPYEDASGFTASDPRLTDIAAIALRTLQMCSHETTMDCPYYEQLQYAGDTRLQCLVAYATCADDRLARQALRAFDRSRSIDGLTKSRTPSRIVQRIPPFSLWWVAMVHDFALWRGDLEFVADLMPGVRAVLDAHRRNVDDDGVFHALDGWNFTDWVGSWPDGAPPGAHWDVSAVLQLQLIHVTRLAAELEGWLGESELSARNTRLADRLSAVVDAMFYDDATGLYADDATRSLFSEHAQALAVLAGATHGEAALQKVIDPEHATLGPVARTTVYFDHYLFEALTRIGRTDAVLDRLELWFDLLDHGLTTVVEQPEPTRSDCHAWGAHPRYHFASSVLGVRPTSPGMATVTVAPQLGGLAWAEGSVTSPYGPIHVRASAEDGVRISAPPEITID
jgi:hypothetical protein